MIDIDTFDPFKDDTPALKAQAPDTNTFPQELLDEIDMRFGPSDRPLKKLVPPPQEYLQQLAAGDDLEGFKAHQAKMIEAKDETYDIQEALEWAVNARAFSVVQEIVEVQGVVPGTGPCGIAIENGDDFYVEYLFKHGADAKAEDEYLVFRAAHVNPCYLPFLAEHGAKNYTAIINQFIDSEHTEAAIYMLEHGAEPTMETFRIACEIDDLTILKHLLADKGMVPSKEFIDDLPPLFNEAKHLLNKAYLQRKLTNKLITKTKSKSQGMKI